MNRPHGWTVALLVSAAGVAFAEGGLDVTFEHKLYPSDGGERDSYSSSMDISGDTMVVSSREDDNENGEDSGAAYVLERDPVTGEWLEVVKLLASNGQEHDYYGESAAIGGDVIAIGSDRRRLVYIYERDEGGPDNWGERQILVASDDSPGAEFGWEVDLTDDGAQLAVSAVGKPGGAVGWIYIFEKDEFGDFQEITKFGPSDGLDGDSFGWGLGLRASGGRVVASAHLKDSEKGGAYVFEDDGTGNWTETAILHASDGNDGDKFGIAASIWDDTVVVGASHDSDVMVKVGSVYVYERNEVSGEWEEIIKLTPHDPGERAFYGRCVANRENVIVIAAPGDDDLAFVSGAAYYYRRDQDGSGAWGWSHKTNGLDSIESDRYAYSIAMDGVDVVIGSDRDRDKVAVTTGSVYTYTVLEGPVLTVTGGCVGQATIDIRNAVPGGRVMLAVGGADGSSTLGGGPCAGATLALEAPRTLEPVAVDGDGRATLVRTLPPLLCGRPMQAVDLSDCQVGNVEHIE